MNFVFGVPSVSLEWSKVDIQNLIHTTQIKCDEY